MATGTYGDAVLEDVLRVDAREARDGAVNADHKDSRGGDMQGTRSRRRARVEVRQAERQGGTWLGSL